MKTFDRIRQCIEKHIETGGLVTAPAKLAERIASELAPRPAAGEFVVGGIRCVRVRGSDLGRRGPAKGKYGWRMFDLSDDSQIGELVPTADHGVPASAARRYAETLDQLRMRHLLVKAVQLAPPVAQSLRLHKSRVL